MTTRKLTKATATFAITLATLVTLRGCGSSGGDTFITPSPTAAPINLTLSANNDTHLTIEWDFVRSADHFHVHEDRAGTAS